ncbi:putative reverse transcriptase domain-containing protein [Tanacetum coccineum]
MAQLQPADENVETVPSYDAKVVSEVHASSKVHEQVSHGKRKTIIQTMDDDQIDSNIIFDDPFLENNGGTSEHDSTAHDEYREIQMLAYNVQREAENQKHLNNELKKQKDLLQRELETFKDRVKTFESTTIQYSTYKETCDELERELRNDKDTIDRLVKGKEQIQNDFLKVKNEKIIIQHETKLEKKAFKERENRLKTKILEAQSEASKDLKAPAEWLRGLERHFKQRDDGEIYFFDRIWIPSVGGVRKLIMDEAHTSRYSEHLGTDKMYYDLRDLYWWPGMKRDIAEYVSRCLTCSKIKAEH